MKKFLFMNFLIIIALSPNLSSAAGLVPCGGPGEATCSLCHLFQLFNNLIKEIFTWVVPTIAVLMLVYGGTMLIFGGGKPETLNQAKGIITSVIIGILIIFAAWIIVNTVLKASGLIDSSSPLWKWYDIPCAA